MANSLTNPPTGIGGLDPQRVLAALSLAGSGRVFDLDIGRFPGMPHHPAQPGFDVVTYLSPQVSSNERQWAGKPPAVDQDNFGVVLEKVTTSMHMGTHLDALCHVTAGEDCHGFGGFNGVDDVGDKGVLANDVTEVPPILARGVLLDVAAVLGVPKLPPRHAITVAELEKARGRAGVELRLGDVVSTHQITLRFRARPAIAISPGPNNP